MTPTRIILLSVLSIKLCVVMILTLNYHMTKIDSIRSTEASNAVDGTTNTTYQFEDPFIAHYLLEKLDVFSTVEDGAINGTNYNSIAWGWKKNINYCEDHRAHFVNNPNELFQEQKFVSNFWHYHKIRDQVISVIGQDLQREIHPLADAKTRIAFTYDIRTDAHLFFTVDLFYYLRQVGKQFSCLTQASNHIPGHDNMYRKDHVGQALVAYTNKYASRPQCFNSQQYFPKTWMLQDKEQCLNFFAEFNSAHYQTLKAERNVVYFRKIGADVHEGQGVFPVTDQEEEKIRTLYNNGSLCGTVKDNNLIQYNVHNPLLLENRKFGFRSFLLIASTNPVIAYYHDGYLRLSLDEYNAKSKDIKTFVTNIGVNLKEATKDTAFKTMTPDEIQEHTTWFLEKFHLYLLEKGIVKDPNWLDNYLRPQFKKVMIHLTRMAKSAFMKKSSVYELFGIDFVMDEDLGLWFIEANTMPLIHGFTKDSTVLMNRMLTDTFEIIFGLLRSRAKRIINYVNDLTVEMAEKPQGGLEVPDLEGKRKEFDKVSQNRFEPEFEVSAENTFQMIIDENVHGVERYAGLLEADCL